VSVLEGADHATAILPDGKKVPVEEVVAVDELSGLARIRLGQGAPKPTEKLSVRPAPFAGQRVKWATVAADGLIVRTQCTIQSVRKVPYLPGFYHLETSIALPPAGGAVYTEDGNLSAVVIKRFDSRNAGVLVSTEVVVRVAGLKARRVDLDRWWSERSDHWSDSPAARYMEAQVELWSGRHIRVIEILEPVIGSAGTLEGAVSAVLGESYLAMNLLPESIVAFKSAIESGAVACGVYQQLVWAYMETGQYDEAKRLSDKVIEEQGDKPVGYLLLARLHNLQGDHDNAIYEARRALKHHPYCQCAHFERGIAYLGQGRFQAAIESLTVAATLDPTDAEALHGLGYAYLRSGRPGEAIDALRKAAELRPDMAEAWTDLGEAYSRSNRKVEALEAYRQGVCADPKDQGAYYRLASEYMRQGLFGDAIRTLGQGLESCGASAWLTYQLGKAYCCAGQELEARRQARRLSTMNTALAEQLLRYIDVSTGG
jgi:tetratricopeptide (TPR) repeat protein